MSNKTVIESFPILNDDNKKNLSIDLTVKGNYLNENNKLSILNFNVDENDSNIIYCDDPCGFWNPKSYNINIKGSLSIDNLDSLFTTNKIVDEDTILGLAVTVNSKNTSMTFTEEIGEKRFKDGNTNYEFEIEFGKSQLYVDFYIDVILYIKDSFVENSIFASEVGTSLGILVSKNIVVEGKGSIFPIEIVKVENGPLWNMKINYDSIYDDEFSIKTVSLQINSLNNGFKYLEIDKISDKNSIIWKEILSSFFFNLLLYVNRQDGITNIVKLNDEELILGSLAYYIKYIVESFKITNEINNPVLLSNKVRTEIDRIIK